MDGMIECSFLYLRSAYRDFIGELPTTLRRGIGETLTTGLGPQDNMHGMEDGSIQMEFEGDLHL